MKIKNEWPSLLNIGETLVEDDVSTDNMMEYLKRIPHVKVSIINEVGSPNQTVGIEVPSVRVGGSLPLLSSRSLIG